MSTVAEKIKALGQYIQDLLDFSGDSIMAVMSVVFIMRVAASVWPKFPPLTASEAAFYSSAIASFAYSNRGPKS
jgi:hypothetical protein